MKTTTLIITAALASSAALAETRIWTDVNGKTIEAEQVKVTNNQVLLRLMNDREIKVSLDQLSEADRKLAMLEQPPELELKVSAKTNRSNSNLRDAGRRSRVQLEEESTKVTVAVSKSSSAAYELPLNAVLYVMGEWGGDRNEVIDRVDATFTYTERGQVFELESAEFESVKREGGDRRTEYKGWLVVITDSNGATVAMKGSKKEFEENADVLLAAETGTALSNSYEVQDSKQVSQLARNRWF